MKEASVIPEYNNLYGIIRAPESILEFTDRLKNRGWNCRKSSWTEVEVTSPWAELEIIRDGKEIIVHGAIDSDYFESLNSLINEIGYQYKLEIYNEQKELIKTSTNN
ncbi:MAG: hypothetical protein LPK19_15880, partial [Hymenobacteraceae bacterium]|nr:hypothetical protein [Hymenobacteraceae bacterium]MDX5397717.1 hypothetical protein [Hymenobacteraceae bacterium]MDX5513795.1 hypothetical protein [Hymenobacteraceae bacterium]